MCRRNFVAMGASAGFAVAFRAPVGGMLFGLEELVSFWSLNLGVMIFFCCLFGVVTIGVFISFVDQFRFVDSFGLMRPDKYVRFKVLPLAATLTHERTHFCLPGSSNAVQNTNVMQ